MLKYLFEIDENFTFDKDKPFTCILTQPLHVFGINENDQIKIYQKIASNCKNKIILKKHPQDKVKYNDSFQNVINGLVPFELILSTLPKGSEIISLFSTSTYRTTGFEHHNLINPNCRNMKERILDIIKEGL